MTQDRTEEKDEVGISDTFLEVNAFNSNRFNPKSYAGWEDQRAGERKSRRAPGTGWIL